MKRSVLLLLSLIFVFNACYRDDIDDLNKKYDELKKEQERQAELLATYQALLQALENKLTVNVIIHTDNGYKIVFSDGTEMLIRNGSDGHTPVITIGENGNWFVDGVDTGRKSTGQDGETPSLQIVDGYWHLNEVNTGVRAEGTNGENAPAIVGIVDMGGVIVFYMSDGGVITVKKTETLGLWALAEGSMGSGNGQLVYFGYNAVTDEFVRDNSKRLQNYGETPNDLMIYGSKMYCTITGDVASGGVVRVVDPVTGATVRDISIDRETAPQQPRRMTAHGGKLYVTLYSGAVARIDTATFAVDIAPLGGIYSEGICVYGQSLYVCNSGWGEDNTVSVVSLEPFAETETVTVPYNPMHIVSIGNGELYFNTASVWNGPATGSPANLHVLNAATKQVTRTFDIEAEFVVAGKNYVYTAATDWSDYSGIVKKISIADKTVSDFTDAEDKLMFAYKLAVNPLTDEVFLIQQMGQDINRFKADGTHVATLKTGQENGAAITFLNVAK